MDNWYEIMVENLSGINAFNVSYAGEGVFYYDCGQYMKFFYNSVDNAAVYLDDQVLLGNFENGIGVLDTKNFDRLKRISLNGDIGDIILESNWAKGPYSEGVFFCKDTFYDIDGNVVFDMSEYEFNRYYPPVFENGRALLELIGEDDRSYFTILDINGKELYDKQVCDMIFRSGDYNKIVYEVNGTNYLFDIQDGTKVEIPSLADQEVFATNQKKQY
jgi:hypothetical protein